jgi:diacylglycerol kinase family enzyme
MPQLAIKMATGEHLNDGDVAHFRIERATMETEHPAAVEADGEVLGATPVEVGVVASAIALKG